MTARISIAVDLPTLLALFERSGVSEVEVTSAVMGNLMQSYIKPLLKTDTAKKIQTLLVQAAEEEIKAQIGEVKETRYATWRTVELHPQLKEELRNLVAGIRRENTAMAEEAAKKVTDQFAETISGAVERAVAKRMDAAFEREVSRAVTERLNAIHDRLMASLGGT